MYYVYEICPCGTSQPFRLAWLFAPHLQAGISLSNLRSSGTKSLVEAHSLAN